jgi:circadian clock protein KaiC
MDTWIVLANDDLGGHHRRGLYVLKSRGMAHSNELREFALTDHGLDIAANGGSSGTPPSHGHATAEGHDRHAAL